MSPEQTGAQPLADIHQTFIATAMDAFLRVSRDGRILDVNEACCQQLGYTRQELVGMTIAELEANESSEETRQHIARIIATGSDRFESRHRRKDGVIIDIDVSLTFLPEQDCFFSFQRDITARKRLDLELRSSEERYRIVADFTYDWEYWIGTDGTFRYISPSCERLTGYTAAEFHQDPGLLVTIVHPADRDTMERHLGQHLAVEGAQELDFRIVTKGGETRWVSHICQPVRSESGELLGRRATNRDITDKKQAEFALRQSEEKYRDLVQSVNCIIMRCDRNGVTTFLNDYGLAFFGFTAEEMIGRHVCDTIVPPLSSEGRDCRRMMVELFADPAKFQVNISECIRKNGERVWISWANRPVFAEDGTVTEMLAVGTDVTEQKRAELLIITMNEELERRVADRTRELQSALRHMESFSYSISHDLRAPLRAVDGYGRILQEEFGQLIPAAGQRYIQRMSHNVQRMATLIDDLLIFSRLSRQPLGKRPLDLKPLVRELFREQLAHWDGRQVEFLLDDLPVWPADEQLLRQVFSNLLDNALKFTAGREPARIQVGTARDRGTDAIFVRDNGAGFDMAYADKLFGVFQRLHNEAEFSGTGVGLAIVQNIIQRHGGRIWADARVGEGATFYFTLGSDRVTT